MEIIAHRGRITTAYPESSKETFEECLKCSYLAGVECDVRITKDDKVVISHYDRLFNTSKRLKFKSISKLNYQELINMDLYPDVIETKVERLQYTKSKDVLNLAFLKKYVKSIGSLTDLETLLNLYCSKKQVLVDIKVLKETINLDIQEYEKKIMDVLDLYPDNEIAIQSFNPYLLKSIKKHNSHHQVGLLIENNIADITPDYDFISINKKYMTKEVFDKTKLNNQKLMVWTVDTVLQFKQLEQMLGPDIENITLISRYPDIINEAHIKSLNK